MFLFILALGIMYFGSLYLVAIKVNGRLSLNLYNIFLFAFAFVYSILFPICYYLTLIGYNITSFSYYIVNFSIGDILLYYLAIFIVTHTVLWAFRKNKLLLNSVLTYNSSSKGADRVLYVAIVMLVLGLVCDHLYLRAYGGYDNYLNYSLALRSGVVLVNNPFSFLIIFRDCIIFSSYLFFSQIRKNEKFNLVSFVMFLIAFFFTMKVLYSNSGRLSILLYFLILLLFYLCRNKTWKYINLKIMAIGLGVLIIFVWAAFFVGHLLSRNIADNILLQMTKEFSFIFVNFKVQLENLTFDNYRFFIDVILLPVFILPSSIWSSRLGVQTASTLNTIFISGAPKGTGNVYGEMPIDLISLSYMQLGIFGLVVIPLVYSFLFCKIYKFAKQIRNTEASRIICLYVVFVIGIETIFYADPQHIVYRAFDFIIFMILYKVFSKVSFTKRKHI